MEQEIIQVDERTWRIEDGTVRFFVLEGKDEALVIDTGMQTPNAKEIAESITKLPLKLFNTHADMDHISGNAAFDSPYMNPAEYSLYIKTAGKEAKITPVWDGDVIDLGGRPLEVITLPGHTPGSIALLDINGRVLISGDPIQDGNIFMFGTKRDLYAYKYSLEKLNAHKERFDLIYPSHGSFPVKPELIDKLHKGAEDILEGRISGHIVEFRGDNIKVFDVGAAKFLCDTSMGE